MRFCSSGILTIRVRSEMSSLVWGTGVAPGLPSDTMRHELLWNGLHSVHEVLHDLGHGHANDLLDDLFESCDSLHHRNVRGLILPTSEVGTGRSPPA